MKRRLELRGEVAGIRVYDDFAHHPTAIALTIDGVRRQPDGGRIIAVLEPRSNTMRLGVHREELVESLRRRRRGLALPALGARLEPRRRCRRARAEGAGARRPAGPRCGAGRGPARGRSRPRHEQWRIRRPARAPSGGAPGAAGVNAEVRELPLFPLNAVLFPGGPLPLRIFEPRYLDMVSRCMREQTGFAVVLLGEGEEASAVTSFAATGTEARIVDFDRLRGRIPRHQLHRPGTGPRRRGLARGRWPQSRPRARHRRGSSRGRAAGPGLDERGRDAGAAGSRGLVPAHRAAGRRGLDREPPRGTAAAHARRQADPARAPGSARAPRRASSRR